jgi:hypothetical protein
MRQSSGIEFHLNDLRQLRLAGPIVRGAARLAGHEGNRTVSFGSAANARSSVSQIATTM